MAVAEAPTRMNLPKTTGVAVPLTTKSSRSTTSSAGAAVAGAGVEVVQEEEALAVTQQVGHAVLVVGGTCEKRRTFWTTTTRGMKMTMERKTGKMMGSSLGVPMVTFRSSYTINEPIKKTCRFEKCSSGALLVVFPFV